jgi:high-affinity iron transporter
VLAAAIIVFRELLEAGLIVGIVFAVTRGVPGRAAWVAGGVAAGVAGSCLLALFTGALSEAFSGAGQELFDAAILGTAVLMLAWHNIWMARHGREMASELKEAGREVADGTRSLLALAVVVGIAVLREGGEVVLFLYGVLVSNAGSSAVSVAAGGAVGLVLGAAVSAATYLGLVRIPAKSLFGVTSVLITLLAAGMAAQCVAMLEQAGVVEWLGTPLWDTSAILSEKSVPGRVLHTLVGYSDQPSELQFFAYAIVALGIVVLTRVMAPQQRRPAAASA